MKTVKIITAIAMGIPIICILFSLYNIFHWREGYADITPFINLSILATLILCSLLFFGKGRHYGANKTGSTLLFICLAFLSGIFLLLTIFPDMPLTNAKFLIGALIGATLNCSIVFLGSLRVTLARKEKFQRVAKLAGHA